ncbi:MAG: ABC transporter ATP-binding protein [Candidatus Bathyarchaeia archaeon]
MGDTIVETKGLSKWFPVRKGFFRAILSGEQQYIKAVDDVSFEIMKGEIFGLAGESGCGKTTTGKTILRLLEPTGGKVYFKEQDVFGLGKRELKEYRKRAQIIYQDPYESLDPRMTIFNFVAEPLLIHKIGGVEERVVDALERTELTPPEEYFHRFPHELSGGQRQRVAIARAMILNPEFIVADEPVSMLDASIRSSILELMFKLRDEMGISYLYITHDLATARQVCDRIAIMYLGKIMEQAPMDELLADPLHPYTQALIAAVPVPDPTAEKSRAMIKGEVPSPVDLPKGCRFNTRCPHAEGACFKEEPGLVYVKKGHLASCHLYR